MSKTRGKNRNKDEKIQINQKLNAQFVPGTKKSDCNKNEIRSYQTLKDYKAVGKRFVDFCKINDLKVCKEYVPQFLISKQEERCSVATLKTYRTALCRIYNLDFKEVMSEIGYYKYGGDFEKMSEDWTLRRQDLKRSRDYYYQDKVDDTTGLNAEIKTVCEASGLRRRELQTLCAANIKTDENGNVYFRLTANRTDAEKEGLPVVSCKGGRSRTVHIFQEPKALSVLEKWAENKDRNAPLLSDKPLNKNLDIHKYRAVFANRKYEAYANPISEIDINDRIKSQRKNRSNDGLVSPIITLHGDLYGYQLDRVACRIVSQELGHNREEVFQASYFRPNYIQNQSLILST